MSAGEPPPGGAPRYDVAGAIWTLIRTDFKVRYHGTVMGFFWAMLKPVAMFLALFGVFYFIFGRKENYAFNLVLGIFLYEYFNEATNTGLISLHQKGYLLTRSRFPRWILALTSTANPLITLLVASAALIGYLTVAGRFPGLLALLLYLVYLVHLVAIVCAFSLASSVLFLRYRDLNQIWEVVARAGFFLAPVIYPLEILPERYHFYLYLWPPTSVIQFARDVLARGEVPTLKAHLLLTGMTLVCLGIGAVIYRRLAPRAAEYL